MIGNRSLRRSGDKSSLAVTSVVAAYVAGEGLCLFPLTPWTLLFLDAHKCRPAALG